MIKSNIMAQGAEAIVTRENNKIIKNRIKKSYRIKEIDEKLRKSRTRSEAKILQKLQNIIPVPKIIKTDEKENIEIEFIKGKKLSESLENLDYKNICKLIADNITKLHNQNIIHGDLTTSNMIYVKGVDKINKTAKVFFIDFGLSFHSEKIEDKAVDLHLLQQALVAKHFTICQECFNIILENYNPKNSELIKKRIKVIESRGRYKEKY